MANGWTSERRVKQSALIRGWKPWERSTGPRAEVGKATSSGNALSHGMRSAAWLNGERRILEILRTMLASVEQQCGQTAVHHSSLGRVTNGKATVD